MGSKVIVFLILFLATVLLVSSAGVPATKVAAETSNNVNTSNETIANHGGEGGELSGYEGGEHGGYERGGGKHEGGGEHGGYEGGEGHGEKGKREEHGGYKGPRRGSYGRKRGHYCHYGCCGKSYRPCRRCCTFAGEKAEADEP